METVKISDIEVTLEHGALLDKNGLIILYAGLIDCLMLPLITVGMLIAWTAGVMEWESNMAYALALGNPMLILLGALFLYMLIKDKKLKNDVKLWVEDAVKTIAYSVTIDVWQPIFYMPKETKIQVKFDIGNRLYTKVSMGKAVGGKKGYARFYNKYSDREINILYSRKYDKVLILKDESNGFL